MGERGIAGPCAGGALTAYETRCRTPAAVPLQVVFRAPQLRRQKVYHRRHHDSATDVHRLARHTEARQDSCALVDAPGHRPRRRPMAPDCGPRCS
jgi:hypothetical protein